MMTVIFFKGTNKDTFDEKSITFLFVETKNFTPEAVYPLP